MSSTDDNRSGAAPGSRRDCESSAEGRSASAPFPPKAALLRVMKKLVYMARQERQCADYWRPIPGCEAAVRESKDNTAALEEVIKWIDCKISEAPPGGNVRMSDADTKP